MRQDVLSAVTALLIIVFLSASFTMIAPVEDADAWLRHGCCIEKRTRSFLGIRITYCVRWEVEFHFNPFPHPYECPDD